MASASNLDAAMVEAEAKIPGVGSHLDEHAQRVEAKAGTRSGSKDRHHGAQRRSAQTPVERPPTPAELQVQRTTLAPPAEVGAGQVTTGPSQVDFRYTSEVLPSMDKEPCEPSFPLVLPAENSRACTPGSYCRGSTCSTCPPNAAMSCYDDAECLDRCSDVPPREGNKEWTISPPDARMVVVKVRFSNYGSFDKVGVFSFSHPPSAPDERNSLESVAVLSQRRCLEAQKMSEEARREMRLSHGSACTWIEQTLVVRAPWTRLAQDVGVLIRASCWTLDCHVGFSFSSYASPALCEMGTLGTSPFGVIDALDPLEYYWPGTAPTIADDPTTSISNLTLHPFGAFEDATVRYTCGSCNENYPLTPYIASSAARDRCMSRCGPGTVSGIPSWQGLGSSDRPCTQCDVGKYQEAPAQMYCDECEPSFVTPDRGAPSRDWCYRAELVVERIWRMGQDIAVQVQWQIEPANHARADDMISIHSGEVVTIGGQVLSPAGRRQLAWAYTSSDSANQEHNVPGAAAVPLGSHTLYFESAGIQFYHVRYRSMKWNTTYGKVLFDSLRFRLDDEWLKSGSCKDRPSDGTTCIPEDTGQQILDAGILCAEGAVARHWDFTKCPPCPRGEAGLRSCAKCARGFYADEAGLSECKSCLSTGSRATSFATISVGAGADCEGEGCCVPCSQVTGLPIPPQCVETDNTAPVQVEATTALATTPPPTTTILVMGSTTTAPPRQTTTAAPSTTTPPPVERECGNGRRKLPTHACWTPAFGGLVAKIENSMILACPDFSDDDLDPDFILSEWSQGGDERYHAAEECDDGNQYNGDGCSDMCTVEAFWSCDKKTVRNTDRCTSAVPNTIATLKRFSNGPRTSGLEDLDWFPLLAQADGILQVQDYKMSPGMEPRASGWSQLYLAAGASRDTWGGLGFPPTSDFAIEDRLDSMRLPGLFKVAEDTCATSRNTHATRHLNPFTQACAAGVPGADQAKKMSVREGVISASGRDRSHSKTCEWQVTPPSARSIEMTLHFNLRPHKDRLEIWDSGAYERTSGGGGTSFLVRGECYPCAFPAPDEEIPGSFGAQYKEASRCGGRVKMLTAKENLQ